MMKNLTLVVLGGSLLLSFFYVGVSYFLLWSLASSSHKPLEVEPDESRCSYETVSFTPRGESFKLEGWFMKPKLKEGYYTLIFVHGIATNRVSNEHSLEIAYDFIKRGFNVLMFDLRTQGNSEGDFASASHFEKFDVLGAFDFLHKEKKISTADMGLLGFSMGGATALLAASLEPKITALAVDSPFSDARELIAQETATATGLPFWMAELFVPMVRVLAEKLYKIELDEMVPKEAVKKIKFPILLIHGDSDTTLSHSHSEKIHKNAHHESILHITPDASHTGSYGLDQKSYIKKMFDYYMKQSSKEAF